MKSLQQNYNILQEVINMKPHKDTIETLRLFGRASLRNEQIKPIEALRKCDGQPGAVKRALEKTLQIKVGDKPESGIFPEADYHSHMHAPL